MQVVMLITVICGYHHLRLLRRAGCVEQLVQALLHPRDLGKEDLDRLRNKFLWLILPS
jgi:hypothetical protein